MSYLLEHWDVENLRMKLPTPPKEYVAIVPNTIWLTRDPQLALACALCTLAPPNRPWRGSRTNPA